MTKTVTISSKGQITLPNVEPAAAVSTVISQVLDSGFIEPSCLRRTGWDRFLWLPIPQLHHRMIAADAVDRRCALVSNDPAFGSVGDLKLVWRGAVPLPRMSRT